jgi:hypothetical protein
MLRIKDENGSVLSGLLRNNDGSIVAEPDELYERYVSEKQRIDQINNLTTDVESLKTDMASMKEMLIEILNKVTK